MRFLIKYFSISLRIINSFNLRRLQAAYRQLLTVPREAVKEMLIVYISNNGLFDGVTEEVQVAVVGLIDDTFMDKIKRYMESKIQLLRIGQSADVIATQTPKSVPSGSPPTPPTASQKRVITKQRYLAHRHEMDRRHGKAHRYPPSSNSQPNRQKIAHRRN